MLASSCRRTHVRLRSIILKDAACEWSYLFITFLMVMEGNNGTRDDFALFHPGDNGSHMPFRVGGRGS